MAKTLKGKAKSLPVQGAVEAAGWKLRQAWGRVRLEAEIARDRLSKPRLFRRSGPAGSGSREFCKGMTAQGEGCRNPVREPGFCWRHTADDPAD